MHIGGKNRDDVVACFQQTYAQRARAFSLHPRVFILLAFGRHDSIDDNDA
jgi:hypothetical protein